MIAPKKTKEHPLFCPAGTGHGSSPAPARRSFCPSACPQWGRRSGDPRRKPFRSSFRGALRPCGHNDLAPLRVPARLYDLRREEKKKLLCHTLAAPRGAADRRSGKGGSPASFPHGHSVLARNSAVSTAIVPPRKPTTTGWPIRSSHRRSSSLTPSVRVSLPCPVARVKIPLNLTVSVFPSGCRTSIRSKFSTHTRPSCANESLPPLLIVVPPSCGAGCTGPVAPAARRPFEQRRSVGSGCRRETSRLQACRPACERKRSWMTASIESSSQGIIP